MKKKNEFTLFKAYQIYFLPYFNKFAIIKPRLLPKSVTGSRVERQKMDFWLP